MDTSKSIGDWINILFTLCCCCYSSMVAAAAETKVTGMVNWSSISESEIILWQRQTNTVVVVRPWRRAREWWTGTEREILTRVRFYLLLSIGSTTPPKDEAEETAWPFLKCDRIGVIIGSIVLLGAERLRLTSCGDGRRVDRNPITFSLRTCQPVVHVYKTLEAERRRRMDGRV